MARTPEAPAASPAPVQDPAAPDGAPPSTDSASSTADTGGGDQAGETAKPAAPPAPPLKARVLVDGAYGRINTVATIPADLLDAAIRSGEVDPHPDAVSYAQALALGKP